MSKTRPYLVSGIGDDRMVQAISQEQAIAHVVKPLVKCHAASASEVAQFANSGKRIETAGVYPEPEGVLSLRGASEAGERQRSMRITLEPGTKWAVGDVLVPLGEGGKFRQPGEGDQLADGVRVGEGAELQEGDQLVWRWTHERQAPDAAIAHDGHNVQTAEQAQAGASAGAQ